MSEWVEGKGLQQQLLVVVTGSASNYCSSPCTSSSEESASEHLDCSPAVYRGWCWCWCWCLKIASDKSKNVSLMLAWAFLWRCCCCCCCVTAPTVDKKESCCCWCAQKMKPFHWGWCVPCRPLGRLILRWNSPQLFNDDSTFIFILLHNYLGKQLSLALFD